MARNPFKKYMIGIAGVTIFSGAVGLAQHVETIQKQVLTPSSPNQEQVSTDQSQASALDQQLEEVDPTAAPTDAPSTELEAEPVAEPSVKQNEESTSNPIRTTKVAVEEEEDVYVWEDEDEDEDEDDEDDDEDEYEYEEDEDSSRMVSEAS